MCKNKSVGFTLAEVLITLGIVGVVAAMTIPNLMNYYKAQKLRSQFLKSYSIVQQVFKQMEADDVSLNPRDYPSAPDTLFYKTFIKYLQAPIDCGNYYTKSKALPCYDFMGSSAHYKTLNGSADVPVSVFDAGQIVLQDGTLLLFNSDNYGFWVSVDLNGYNGKPNKFGYDLFTFEFQDGVLRTMGDISTKYQDMSIYCDKNSKHYFNGIACANKAKADTDYFKTIVKTYK